MASSFDKLPVVLLSGVLQRLPAKDLCRLRTVCRSWRSLTSDQAFIRAHADRHKEPLFLAKFKYEETHVYVVDLSGNVVKRIAGAEGGHQVMRNTHLNLACLATEWNRCRLLNPATGRIRKLPLIPAISYEYEDDGLCMTHNCTFFALGLVAATGKYKLLRYWLWSMEIGHRVQVLTIDGGSKWNWRPRPGPRCYIEMHSGVVVGGVVYFFMLYSPFIHSSNTPADTILSFDLDTEEWRRDLHGPLYNSNLTSEELDLLWRQLTLSDLKGSLVLAHHRRNLSTLDLWFLVDFESGLWVKEYSIQSELVSSRFANIRHLIPLLVLHDGRLVIYVLPIGRLFICDPGTNTFTRVDKSSYGLDSVGVYTGSLLSLQEGAMV